MARILVAEDEKSIGTLLVYALGSQGHEVYVSPNGEHALETLEHNESFDLLICDMKMPKMDGRQLIEALSRQEDLADIPIIIMSGYVSMAEIDDLLQAGAEAFLAKPINLTELEKAVYDALKFRQPAL